jgi:alpha-galactosidase
LLHTGRVVRADPDDPAGLLHGVVAHDQGEALFAHVQLTTTVYAPSPPIRLPGLAPSRTYQVRIVQPGAAPVTIGTVEPPWLATGAELPGSALAEIGLPAPLLGPEQLILLHVTAVS